jgi:hypothetical protein
MGVGLTSLGHLWAGRRRPHNNYVIGNPADTTPIVHSAEHYAARAAGQRPQGGPQRSCSGATIPGPAGRRPNRDCGPQGGAAEELLGNYAISARRLQTSMGELRAKCGPRRSCLVLRDSASPTADLSRDACSGGAAGATCRSKHLKALRAADSEGAAGRTGRRSSMTSEAGHVGGTVTGDY